MCDLLKTLGVCGWYKLQHTINDRLGVSIPYRPLRTFLDQCYGKGGRLAGYYIHQKAMKAVRDSGYDEEVARAKPIYDELLQLFTVATCTIAQLLSMLSGRFEITMSKQAAMRLLVRMQWHAELSQQFVPTAYRPVLHDTDPFDWPLRDAVTSWTYCTTCGRRQPRKQKGAIGVQFQCPETIVSVCKVGDKDFATGCCHDPLSAARPGDQWSYLCQR